MSWMPLRRSLPLVAVLALGLNTMGWTTTPLMDQVASAKDLVCEMRPTTAQRRRTPSLMLFIEGVDATAGSARLASSSSAGTRPVNVYWGTTGVHFVENVASSVRVTSLLGCEVWKSGTSGSRCLRYEAVSAWHFDTSVHRDVDQAFLRLGTTSFRGTCEPWRV